MKPGYVYKSKYSGGATNAYFIVTCEKHQVYSGYWSLAEPIDFIENKITHHIHSNNFPNSFEFIKDLSKQIAVKRDMMDLIK